MTENIRRLFLEDPKELTDDAVLFEFVETDGQVKLVDALAAGGAWYEIEFVSGSFAERRIWCSTYGGPGLSEEGPIQLQYQAHTTDDGFLFNRDPDRQLDDSKDEVDGGGYYPAWDGKVLTVKET